MPEALLHAFLSKRRRSLPPPPGSPLPAVADGPSAHALLALKGSPSHSVDSATSRDSVRESTGVDTGDACGSDSDGPRSASGGRRPLKRKFRKATHTVRKEEKEHLLAELECLQTQLSELKRRALDVSAAQPSAQPHLTNAVLRDVLQQQLAQFTDAQVRFSEYGMTQVCSPIGMPLRLGRERAERYATLSAMKDAKLQASRAFLRRRCGALDVRRPYCEDQRFETATGDYCAVRFSVLQFEGVQSVQQVYDVLRFQFCNIEISISEKVGTITIREDDDMGDAAITQHRLVGTTARGVRRESNSVLFAEYRARDAQQGGGEFALLSAEFVDDDALYPYRPDQRVRRDMNAILQLTSFTRRAPDAAGGGAAGAEQQLVVVLTHWTHSRLHRPAFPVPETAMHELRENAERWGESMHRILREALHPDG
ncbi:hypothetical protein PybrP1_010762 [[Pythium] brassicae (nom. inval.)]|nr:hypothetical protein PybrP1_010762 [[Pythium] brassicae (nom. inval.)]